MVVGQSGAFKRAFFILVTFFSILLVGYILIWSFGIVNTTSRFSSSRSSTLLKDCSRIDFEILSQSIDYDSGYIYFTMVNSGLEPIYSFKLKTDLEEISINVDIFMNSMQELEIETDLNKLQFTIIPEGCEVQSKFFYISEE